MADKVSNFVCTVPLRTTPGQRHTLRTRLEAARSAYNALLGECLRRLKLMRESKAWRAARKMPKGKEKSKTYRELNKKFGFREYDLYPFIKQLRKSFIGDHLDSHTVMALAARAFATVERWVFNQGGKPRFRRFGEMRSVQGIGGQSPMNWKNGKVVWFGLEFEPIIDEKDPLIAYAFKHKICLVRIVRMVIRGFEHYYAQITFEGEPYIKPKHKLGNGVVGLDIGPSTIAIVSEKTASLQRFCDELKSTEYRLRCLQRQADRQRRKNNPHCFDEKGRWIKGQRLTVFTKAMRDNKTEMAEISRREAEHRKNLHGRLVHQILALGNDIRLEKVSYKSFQRNFGRSCRYRAPGMFVETLRKAGKKFGALVTEFDTYKTKLSQTCPQCGTVRKKKLSERWHQCACGCAGQRDIVSALLATCVADNTLDMRQARKTWRRLCNTVGTVSSANNGRKSGNTSVLCNRPSDKGKGPSYPNAITNRVSGSDVVAGRKAQARAEQKPVENGKHTLLFSSKIDFFNSAISVSMSQGRSRCGLRAACKGRRKRLKVDPKQLKLWESG